MIKWMTGIVALSILALAVPGAAMAQEPVGCDQTYIVQPGDWLANIAARYYDDPWAYPIIVFATNHAVPDGGGFQIISDPNRIEPGWKLCLPGADAAMGAVGVDTLKNITYRSNWTKDGTAPLVDGEYSEPAAPGSATKTVVKLLDRMAFGYTADGQQLAAAVLVTDPGGSGTFYDLAAVVFEEGKPQHVASAPLGDRVQLESLALEGGEIVVEMVTQGPDDPMCCPTQRVVQRYALRGHPGLPQGRPRAGATGPVTHSLRHHHGPEFKCGPLHPAGGIGPLHRMQRFKGKNRYGDPALVTHVYSHGTRIAVGHVQRTACLVAEANTQATVDRCPTGWDRSRTSRFVHQLHRTALIHRT